MHRFGGRVGWFAVLAVLVSMAAASPASAAHKRTTAAHQRSSLAHKRSNLAHKRSAHLVSKGSTRLFSGRYFERRGRDSADGGWESQGAYSLVISPGPGTPVGSGQVASIKATFTNESNSRTLGSANLFVPLVAPNSPPFKVVSASAPAGSPTATNCRVLSVSLPCVQLRNVGLAPHASLTVSMQVQTPACQQGSRFVWLALARQSGNFEGDFFTLDLAHSQLRTALDGACRLAFVTNPANAALNQPITGTPDDPTGPPVTVEVLNSNGAVVSGSDAPVTMSLAANPGGATLGGTTTVDASAGVATFTDLTLNRPGNGYELSASSGTLASATSSQFNIAGNVATCNAGQSCAVTDSNANGSIHILANAGPGTGQLVESMESPLTGGQCESYNSLDRNTYFYITTVPRSTVATITIVPQTSLELLSNKILESQQICFGSTKEFVTNQGTPAPAATLPDGTQGFIGLLPTCTEEHSSNPCHDRDDDKTISDDSSPTGYDIVLVANVPASYSGDPHMR